MHLAHEVVTLMNSYTEISQAGNGIHILIRANFPHGKRLEGIEVYGKGRFLVTWTHLPGTPTDILPRQEELTALLAKFRQPTKKRTTTHSGHAGHARSSRNCGQVVWPGFRACLKATSPSAMPSTKA